VPNKPRAREDLSLVGVSAAGRFFAPSPSEEVGGFPRAGLAFWAAWADHGLCPLSN